MNLRIYGNSFQVNCLSPNRYLMLKKGRLRVILVKKKISHNNNLRLYLILTHHGNQALRLFHFSYRKRDQFIFLHKTQISAVS